MDAAGIDMQVLSLNSPGLEQLDAPAAERLAHQTNGHPWEAVRRHPTRFAGFAAIPIALPGKSLQASWNGQCGLWLKGAVVNGHNPRSLPG